MSARTPTEPPHRAGGDSIPARRFRAILALILVAGGAIAAAVLAEGAAANPFSREPLLDAEVYWTWAGAIARGELIGERPYLSAPLYPHLLGIVRAAGGGLGAVYALQLALHLSTAAALAVTGRRLHGPAVGLAAAGLWVVLADPVFFVGRVLACTLQAFTAALLLERMSALREPGVPPSGAVSLARSAAVGALAGLAVLANSAWLIGLPVVALFVAAAAPAGRRLARALVTLACAAAVIAPATAHNYAATGEWIPVSAQAGLTFHHGNQPGATGVYTAAEGVSTERDRQNLDALARAREATGEESWRAADRYWLEQGLSWWRAEPAAALRLAARKAWWFLTGRNYGDVYVPALERADGLASRLALAPLPAAWLLVPAFLALALSLARRPLSSLPEALVLLLPLVVVCVFWYSPRYRLPALPAASILAGLGLASLARARQRPVRAAVFAAAFGFAAGTGALNRARGIDRAEELRPQYEMALARTYLQEDDLERAERHFERARELGAPSARAGLGEVLRRRGDHEASLAALRAAAEEQPDDPFVLRSLAIALAESHRLEEAKTWFERTLAIAPNDWRAESGLGNVVLGLGSPESAIGHYERAIELDPSFVEAHFNLAVAHHRLGQHAEAAESLRRALSIAPDHVPSASLLAWLLASSPDDAVRDGEAALVLAERLCERTRFGHPDHLDALAAAQAELGRYDEAVETATAAIDLLRSAREEEWARDVEARRELYQSGEPYRRP